MYTMFSYRFKFNTLKVETKMGIVLLVMMNALLVLLNIIDVQVTWLGFDASSIDNLAYYVHEGTYYLIFSILLSMAILLVIFRGSQNYLASNKTLKFLAYGWIVQNAFMAISVALRNVYYIDYYYALSFKRIGVMIFIILTLFGLGTMAVKIYGKKTTFWLLKINSTAAVIMLLVMSSFSWDRTIAEFNLMNPDKESIDIEYLLRLNDDALPILDKHKDLLDKDYLKYSFIFSEYSNGLEVYNNRVMDFSDEQEKVVTRTAAGLAAPKTTRSSASSRCWVDVLDDLHQHGRVEAGEPVVLVGQGALEELDPVGLTLAHPVDPQPARGALERPGRHVGADDPRERRGRQEPLEELAGAAAEVDHGPGSQLDQHLVDGLVALAVEGHPLLLGLQRLLVLGGLDGVLDLVAELGQPGQGVAGERTPPAEVATCDQVLLRMVRQPALAGAQQLVHLVGPLPVVLRLVEHRQEHVQLVESVGEPQRAGQPEPT